MRKFIFLFFLLFGIQGYNQNTYGLVEYGKTIDVTTLENSITPAAHKIRSIAEAVEKLNYILTFNTSESEFHVQEMLGQDTDVFLRRAISIGNGDGVFYKNLDTDITLHNLDFAGENFNVQIPCSKYSWELTQIEKNIGSYVCYKAVATRIIKAPRVNLEDEVLHIEAWFTPEIPVSFGPTDINGLPGLVLEARIGKTTYTAKKVILGPTPKGKEILQPKGGRTVTELELEEIAKGLIDKMRKS